ncbi:MAG: hypothetical protein ACYDAN_02470 [Candidatus Limnocylindrales bacterium]
MTDEPEIAPAPEPVQLGARPRLGQIDPRSAWAVAAGARPRVGQLVHLRPVEGPCVLAVVTRLRGADPNVDATVTLAEIGVNGRRFLDWRFLDWRFHHLPGDPRRDAGDWHRLAEHEPAIPLPEPFEDPYARWAAEAGSRPEAGQVVHVFDPANDVCGPGLVVAAGGDPASTDPNLTLAPAGCRGMVRGYRHALPVPSPVYEPGKYGPSWHRVGACHRGR